MTKIFHASKCIYSLVFASIFVNHIVGFQTKYLKYATSDLINEFHLAYMYYFLVFFSGISIFIALVNSRIFYKIYDILFFAYFVFVLSCIVAMQQVTHGCIDCHYIVKIFVEDYKLTGLILFIMAILYLFVIRNENFRQPGNLKRQELAV